MANEDFNREVAPSQHWKTAYPFVEARAKAVLEALPEGATLSTTALVDALYSPEGVIDPRVHKRIYTALKALVLHGLKPYMTLGEPEKVGAQESARRKRWHNGKGVSLSLIQLCPTCKRPL